jgi:predicted anti-sigma-YlaC factor YlaD
MSEHITEWLSPYLDGELGGNLLHQVENHLVECQACREEYRSLQRLSGILQEAHLPEPVSPARFASQIVLRLPPRSVTLNRSKALEVSWWLVPIGLMALWIFIHITFALSDWISTASNLGFINNTTGLILSRSPEAARFASTLGEFGLLGGSELEWATWSESLTRTIFSQMIWQVSIAMLYLSWMAIWWARQRRREVSEFFEAGSRPTVE